MKFRTVLTFGGITLGALGLGVAIKSFLPQRWPLENWPSSEEETAPSRIEGESTSFPAIDITFLRCGTATVPEFLAVRGGLFAPCAISHSAVLIRHPKATFLYDTGLSSDIYLFLADQSWFFRKTLANFVFEQSLQGHLQQAGIDRRDLAFALLSHLHWDHVSGIPDIPGVPLRINRVEYEAARLGLLDAQGGLIRQLMGDNPLEFFEYTGPAYEGFRSSYDLFGDGSIVLVPLPGHTAGNTGMFINRSNGSRLFLLGDAAWVSQNYLRPTTMHPFIWAGVTSDDATARQTLIQLHHFAQQHPDISMIAMHDAPMQEAFMAAEPSHAVRIRTR